MTAPHTHLAEESYR